MTQVRIIYKDSVGYEHQHDEAADSIKVQSVSTATAILTDAKLVTLVNGGNADSLHSHSGLAGSDFLSGYYKIGIGESILIPINKQMTTVGTLTLDGTLTIEGQLCLI